MPRNLKQFQFVRITAQLSPSFGRYTPCLTLGCIQSFAKIPKTTDNTKLSLLTRPCGFVNLYNNLILPHDWTLGLNLSPRGPNTDERGVYGSESSSLFEKSNLKMICKLILELASC